VAALFCLFTLEAAKTITARPNLELENDT
jgi:hypothetical protein